MWKSDHLTEWTKQTSVWSMSTSDDLRWTGGVIVNLIFPLKGAPPPLRKNKNTCFLADVFSQKKIRYYLSNIWRLPFMETICNMFTFSYLHVDGWYSSPFWLICGSIGVVNVICWILQLSTNRARVNGECESERCALAIFTFHWPPNHTWKHNFARVIQHTYLLQYLCLESRHFKHLY